MCLRWSLAYGGLVAHEALDAGLCAHPETGLAGDGMFSTISNSYTNPSWPCSNAVSKSSFVPPKAAAEFIQGWVDGPPIRLDQCATLLPLSYGARVAHTGLLAEDPQLGQYLDTPAGQ